ncbi:hypothetical protein BH23CHL2_BH23CHL2_33220 [soil metagenome]
MQVEVARTPRWRHHYRRRHVIFVGREQEVETLRAALIESLSGRASLAFVSGEIGIGKSTIVQVVAREAADRDVRIVSGLCYDMETTAPYSPWIDLARLYHPAGDEPELPADIENLIEGTVPSPPAIAGEFERFLLTLASERGVLLILEDLQWADQASLELMRILARRLRSYPIAIVATYRDSDLQPRVPLYRMLPTLIRETRAARINLPRLSRSALEDFVRARYYLPDPDIERLVSYVARYAEGNPFFCEELLHALETERILVEVGMDGPWSLGDLDTFQMPLLLRQIIDSRLARLTEETRKALQIAAVIGEEVPLPLWQELTGLDIDDLAGIVDDAMSGGLIEESAGRQHLGFRHALVREALYDSLILLRRRVIHRQIGDALAHSPSPDPDSVSHHYFLAGEAKAADWLILAARRSIQAASYLAAASKFEEAFAILEQDDSRSNERTWLLLEVSEAYRYVDTPRALTYLDIALEQGRESGDDALVTVATWLRGRTRALSGENSLSEIDAAVEMYEALPANQVERIRKSSLGSVISYGALAPMLAHFGRHRQSIECVERFFQLLEGGKIDRDPNEIGDAYLALALSYAALGEIDRARRAFESARRRRVETGHHHGVAAAYDWEYVALDKAYFGDNAALGRKTIQLADEAWLKSDFVQILDADVVPHITEGHILLGEWEEARKRAQACLAISVLRSGSTLLLAELDRLQGDQDSARSRIRAAIPYGPEIEPSVWLAHNTMEMMRVAAELALDRMDIERAEEWTSAYGRWAAWTERLPSLATHRILLAQLSLSAGHTGEAALAARDALKFASSPRQPLPIMTAHRILGEIATEQGELENAQEHLQAALEIAVAADAPYEQARCKLSFAWMERARGQQVRASQLVDEVRDVAKRLGSHPLLDKLEHFAQAEAGPTTAPELPGGLTPREIDVLRLVARGMTDAEVADQLHISPRTVGRHLSSIYDKLKVSSRTSAAAFAYEHGMATD